MRQIGRKLRQSGEGIFEASEHFVVAHGERLQFFRPAIDWHSFMEARRTGAIDRLSKISERPQDAAGHKERDARTSDHRATDNPSEKQGITSSKLLVMCSVLGELQRQLLAFYLR